jgi:hypothetical protein
MELKLNHDNLTQRTKLDLMHSVQEINSYISDKFISEISYDDWLTVAKSLLDSDVYKGAKTENGKRKMSIVTLLRRFGYISSIISYAQQQNIPIDNLPLKIIQTFIRPLMDKK